MAVGLLRLNVLVESQCVLRPSASSQVLLENEALILAIKDTTEGG